MRYEIKIMILVVFVANCSHCTQNSSHKITDKTLKHGKITLTLRRRSNNYYTISEDNLIRWYERNILKNRVTKYAFVCSQNLRQLKSIEKYWNFNSETFLIILQ